MAKSPYLNQLEEWLVMSHGWNEPISKAEYDEIGKMDYDTRKKHSRFAKISGWGMSNGQYYLHHNPDYQGFVRLSEIMILTFKGKKGNFTFEVLEEGMLAHVEAGMSWETASFDYNYA